jgi:hypothetical protein
MVTFESTYDYITKPSDLLVRINRIQAIIDTFENAIVANATSAHLQEYSLDDGQSKIKTGYRSMKELTDGLMGLDLLLQRLVVRYNKLNNGSVIRLVDSKNLRRWC